MVRSHLSWHEIKKLYWQRLEGYLDLKLNQSTSIFKFKAGKISNIKQRHLQSCFQMLQKGNGESNVRALSCWWIWFVFLVKKWSKSRHRIFWLHSLAFWEENWSVAQFPLARMTKHFYYSSELFLSLAGWYLHSLFHLTKTFLRSLQNQGQGNSEITWDIVRAFKTQYLSSKKVRFVERDRKTAMFCVWNPLFPVSD